MCQDLKGSQLSTIAKVNTYLKRISPKRKGDKGFYFIWFKSTLLRTNISPTQGMFEDDFPIPQVGYVGSLEGSLNFVHCVIPAKRLQLAGRFQGHKAKKSLRSQLPPDAELVLEAADEKVGEGRGKTFHQK